MYEVFWYWFVAIMEGVVTVKTRIAKYISYTPNNTVSAKGVNLRFQYFLIYFNYIFQDTI